MHQVGQLPITKSHFIKITQSLVLPQSHRSPTRLTSLLDCYCQLSTFSHLTLNLLTTTIVAPPSNASKWQMGFNSAFKGLSYVNLNLLTTTIVAPPSNASKWQMGFNSAFKGLSIIPVSSKDFLKSRIMLRLTTFTSWIDTVFYR